MNNELAIFIVSGTVGMLILVAFIIFFIVSYQKKSFKTQLKMEHMKTLAEREATLASFQGQESERQRISKELHDDISAMLTATKMKVNFLGIKVKKDESLSREIQDIKTILTQSIDSTRALSQNLMPYSLTKFGLSQSVEQLINKISSPPEFIASFKLIGEPVELESETRLMLFRSIQEIINNCIKHSHASSLQVNFNWSDEKLKIHINDNGVGFDYEKKMDDINTGLGIKNIESRLHIIDASHEIVSNSKGTNYNIVLKLNEKNKIHE